MSLLHSMPSILINMLSILNFIFIMQLFFGLDLCKKWQHYLVVAGTFILMNTGIVFVVQDKEWAHTLLVYVSFLVIVAVLAKRRFWKMLLCTIPTILLYVQWSEVLRMVDRLFRLEKYTVDDSGELFGPIYLSADLILVIVLGMWIAYVYRTGRRVLLNIWETLILCLLCLFSPFLVEVLEGLEEMTNSSLYSVGWILFMIIFNAAILYGILHRNLAHFYRGEAENYRNQFAAEYDYFKDYRKQQKATVDFRHDWNNHMLLLQGMLAEGNYEKVAEYLHTLSEAPFRGKTVNQNHFGRQILTGNELVDIILSAKAERMEELQVEVSSNGGLRKLSFMEDVDICVLFSNLIDNAIEANEKCEGERFLTIYASHNSAMLMIAISNRMNGTLKEQDGRILSSKKEDDAPHGIGMRNAFSVIRKYGGEYSVQTNNQIFTITITFPVENS